MWAPGRGPIALAALAVLAVGSCSRAPEAPPANAAVSPAANPAPGSPTAAAPVAPPPASSAALSPSPASTPPASTPPTAADPAPPAPTPAAAAADGWSPPPSFTSAPGSFTARTRAVEVRIEGVERVREIAGRAARPGHEFVIVDTSWKNIIPLKLIDKTASQNPTAGFGLGAKKQAPDPANQKLEPTAYVVPMLKKQMWLLSDERFADTVEIDVLESMSEHLSKDGFSLPKLDDVVRGKVVFEAPANVEYQAFQFYDTDNGHALIPLKGAPPSAPAPAVGPARHNELLQLAVTEAGPAPSGVVAPPGMRAFVVGIRGTSRSPKDIVDIPFRQFVYAQNEQGCLARPESSPAGLTRAFEDIGSFPPTGANEGQLLFFVPAETKGLKVLLRSATGAPIDLPAPGDFKVSWPAPSQSITDGTTLRLHVLPASSSTTPADGTRRLLDVVVENLSPTRGVELQAVQLRLVRQDGAFVEPSASSSDLPCRLVPDTVIPPASARRFALAYDIAPGEKVRLNYRGFELDETTVDLP